MKLSSVMPQKKLLLLFSCIFAFYLGCKKSDTLESDNSKSYSTLKERFFNTSKIDDKEIKKLAADIKRQDSIFKFLPEFVKQNGIPRWDKILYKSRTHKNNVQQRLSPTTNSSFTPSTANSANGNGNQGIFLIPLQSITSPEIQSYITAYKHDDSLYTYRLFNRDSINSIQPGSISTKANMLNTQAIFAYFEKSVNNVDSISIQSPTNGNIKNVNINFDSTSQQGSLANSGGVVMNTPNSGQSCILTLTTTITYEWRDFTYGPGEWVTIGITLTIELTCDGSSGGGSCNCSTGTGTGSGGSTIGSGGTNTSTSYNWWNYGSGWPYFNDNFGYNYNYTPDPNWYWWWTGGGGATLSSNVSMLAAQLNLTFSQTMWLEQHSDKADQIYTYLQTTNDAEAYSKATEHIYMLINDPGYNSFNEQHSSFGDPNKIWWEDDSWLDDPSKFNLDTDLNQNQQYDKLTAAEKILVKKYPIQAYAISKNKSVAETETTTRFGANGLNDKSDAFRHAFFNAMNMRDCGRNPQTYENIAKLFSDAHETETPSQLIKEKQMDLWNNNIGHQVGDVMFPIFTSNSSLSDDVFIKLQNGELRYLKPVLPPPPALGNDPNFYGTGGVSNPLTATHGITSATQLTPTNQ